MENIILVGVDGRPSMKNVYSKMTNGCNLVVRRRLPRGKRYRVYRNNISENPQIMIDPNFRQCRKIIRWGTQEVLDGTSDNTIIYNKGTALKLVSNKYESRLAMAKAGVSVPLNITDTTHEDLINYPIIARPHHHSKGKNFITLKSRREFLDHYRRNHTSWYYSNFINKEIGRAHV